MLLIKHSYGEVLDPLSSIAPKKEKQEEEEEARCKFIEFELDEAMYA